MTDAEKLAMIDLYLRTVRKGIDRSEHTDEVDMGWACCEEEVRSILNGTPDIVVRHHVFGEPYPDA